MSYGRNGFAGWLQDLTFGNVSLRGLGHGGSSTRDTKHYIYLHIATFTHCTLYTSWSNWMNTATVFWLHWMDIIITLALWLSLLYSSQRLGSPSPWPRVSLNVCLTLYNSLAYWLDPLAIDSAPSPSPRVKLSVCLTLSLSLWIV
jgi:hypothetical protein